MTQIIGDTFYAAALVNTDGSIANRTARIASVTRVSAGLYRIELQAGAQLAPVDAAPLVTPIPLGGLTDITAAVATDGLPANSYLVEVRVAGVPTDNTFSFVLFRPFP